MYDAAKFNLGLKRCGETEKRAYGAGLPPWVNEIGVTHHVLFKGVKRDGNPPKVENGFICP